MVHTRKKRKWYNVELATYPTLFRVEAKTKEKAVELAKDKANFPVFEVVSVVEEIEG